MAPSSPRRLGLSPVATCLVGKSPQGSRQSNGGCETRPQAASLAQVMAVDALGLFLFSYLF
jgi:hypothetical protein